MIHAIFNEILQMSIASVLVIAVILIVRIPLKRFPRIFSYMLWGILLIRLLMPFSLEISYREIGEQIVFQDEPSEDSVYIEYIEHASPELQQVKLSTPIYPYIWLAGILVLSTYYLLSYIFLRRRLVGAVPYNQDEDIYFADYIQIPFVIGAMYPKIYLPSALAEKEFGYIILHELNHVRRKDHIVKPLALLALTLHWFNPFVWMAFHLATKDMEMSCDEAVLRQLGEEERTAYFASMLQLSTGKKLFPALSIAFGENDTKDRIKYGLKWKKSSKIKIAVAVLLVSAIAAIGILIPRNKESFHPYEWIAQTNFNKLECEYVDEELLRDLVYVLQELRMTDFDIYSEYTSEIELDIEAEGQEIQLIYGKGLTLFVFPNSINEGKIWGTEDKDLANCIKAIARNRQDNIEAASDVEPWKPSKSEIEQLRASVLEGISEEDLNYITDLVKVMNLELEAEYLYENQFEAYQDWKQIDFDKYRLYINGVGKRMKNDLLKQDIEEMLALIEKMEKDHDVNALRRFFYKLHDMDYYLFRYGANELWFYIHDKSFVQTYYDALSVYSGLRAE